jgi:hypothetical protein
VRSLDLGVDFLVPARGRSPEGPVFAPQFGLSATPLRVLEYLLESPVRAVVVGPRPVLVNLPQPSPFAFHKTFTASQRSAARDLAQASCLVEVLAEDRLDDLIAAWRALAPYRRFHRRVERALDRLEPVRGQTIWTTGLEIGARAWRSAGCGRGRSGARCPG